eukprot:snap_masked-scaffold906_size82779-processed-gene-0.4 protein:Tk11972 transcript:snap_masked-scaffold906_size82779-processed-gene-0.4-mRNA-1 annotation:"conserved hypothetical protein"
MSNGGKSISQSHLQPWTPLEVQQPVPPGEEFDLEPEGAAIQRILDQFRDGPLVGIEYVVEIIRPCNPPNYHCFLCDRDFDGASLISDLLSAEHRLNYLRANFPIAAAKFDKVPSMSAWERPTLDFLESCAMRIESKFGRLKPHIIRGEDYFAENVQMIFHNVRGGQHFNESEALNFATLPDPFGSYIFRIDPREVRGNESFGGKPDQGLDHIENPEMQDLMQREIARFREQGLRSSQDPQNAELMLESLPFKDDQRGEGFNSKFMPNLPSGSRDNIGEGDGSPGKSEATLHRYKDRRSCRSHAQRTVPKSPEPFRQENSKDANRRRPNRGTNDRNRGTSERNRSRRRSPEPRTPRRSRSKERARRSRSRERRRSRSLSPFSQAKDRWHKFRKSEKVMLSTINRKKDIYDKRPEDHPLYAEEWTRFWEKRYQEVQEEGGNPDEYDYKSDWIPFWGNKVTEIFARELQEKTDDLLLQFNLTGTAEPVRGDFESHNKAREDRRKAPAAKIERRPRERSPRRDESTTPMRRDARSRSPARRRSRGGARSSPTRFEEEDRQSHHGWQDSRSSFHDAYSGISALEEKRDGADSLSGIQARRMDRSPISQADFEDANDGPVMAIPCLRQLTALEDTLGSLGPQINAILGKALALEQTRVGSSNLLMQNPDTACILDMVKEKLSGQMVAGLLDETKLGAVRVAMSHLVRLLRSSTKKRPLHPPTLSAVPMKDGRTKFKEMVAEQMAKILIKKGRGNISDHDLHCVVFQAIKRTELDDGTIQPPLYRAPTPPPQPSIPAHSMPGPSYITPNNAQANANDDEENEALEDFDDLSIEELKSLLANFKDLSKQEQKDLIRYMKKLERTDPHKVAFLRRKDDEGPRDVNQGKDEDVRSNYSGASGNLGPNGSIPNSLMPSNGMHPKHLSQGVAPPVGNPPIPSGAPPRPIMIPGGQQPPLPPGGPGGYQPVMAAPMGGSRGGYQGNVHPPPPTPGGMGYDNHQGPPPPTPGGLGYDAHQGPPPQTPGAMSYDAHQGPPPQTPGGMGYDAQQGPPPPPPGANMYGGAGGYQNHYRPPPPPPGGGSSYPPAGGYQENAYGGPPTGPYPGNQHGSFQNRPPHNGGFQPGGGAHGGGQWPTPGGPGQPGNFYNGNRPPLPAYR